MLLERSFNTDKSQACTEADRDAFLGLKIRILKDTTDILSSWTGRDCRGEGRKGVQCNQDTGRVTGLQLQRPSVKDSGLYMKFTMSPSGFTLLRGDGHQWGEADGRSNFAKPLKSDPAHPTCPGGQCPGRGHPFKFRQIPESISQLQNLCYLNLSRNALSNPLPSTFYKGILSLLPVDMSYNKFNLWAVPEWIRNR
ncbi:LOW QUALITY PROTEIN: hypothetical protein RJ640_012281 [Escallonia rubra]|uniref:Uncharacterized protein n=1 Tax=Escallonia rubra TaxID=112253 RepID=A0AA88R6X2_9ASTE|nr:LOW QUALITY PROTEIN: hypothetical protein RJ640_012281 [Escallonia rubra]